MKPPQVAGERTNSANTCRLFLRGVPVNPDLVDLIARIDAEKAKPQNARRSLNEIAREFTGEIKGDDKKAQSLLSQAQRMKRRGRATL